MFQHSSESMDSDTLLVFRPQQRVMGLENGIFSPTSPASANAWDDQKCGSHIISCPHAEQPGSYPYETDGGVRLAGGRPGEAVSDIIEGYSNSGESTLPPPYASHVGEAECV